MCNLQTPRDWLLIPYCFVWIPWIYRCFVCLLRSESLIKCFEREEKRARKRGRRSRAVPLWGGSHAFFVYSTSLCKPRYSAGKKRKTALARSGKEQEREGVRIAHEGSFCNLGWMLACSLTRSIRGNPFRFLWSVIWKTDAPPWREVMTDEARK